MNESSKKLGKLKESFAVFVGAAKCERRFFFFDILLHVPINTGTKERRHEPWRVSRHRGFGLKD